MTNTATHLENLRDIKSMMERSSRFLSLSGLSGISAGSCALVGAWAAANILKDVGSYNHISSIVVNERYGTTLHAYLGEKFFFIAVCTFLGAFLSAFFFTYRKSVKDKRPVWDASARRLTISMAIPLFVGGAFLLRLIEEGEYGLVAPGCLLFYGLALVNASKHTLGEVRFLGYSQLMLGLLNLRYVGFGLELWAIGFGVMHILYGAAMWWKYERPSVNKA